MNKEKKTEKKIYNSNSVVKWDPNTEKVQKNAIYLEKTQHVNSENNPLDQATKWHLNNS